jgi:hypothetical protein
MAELILDLGLQANPKYTDFTEDLQPKVLCEICGQQFNPRFKVSNL